MRNNLLALILGGLIVFVVVDKSQDLNFQSYGDGVEQNESVETVLPVVVRAFDEAEEKILDVAPTPIDDGTDPDPKKCICKGTGKIVQGDGHVTSCPYHGKHSAVVPTPTPTPAPPQISKPAKVSDSVEVPRVLPANLPPVMVKEASPFKNVADKPKGSHARSDRLENNPSHIYYQLILFTASWCSPCEEMKRDVIPLLKAYGLDVSNKSTADFRIIDIDTQTALYNKYKSDTSSIPMIVEVKDNRIISRETGKKTIEELFNRYDLEKRI